MPGLVPGIVVLSSGRSTWMADPAMNCARDDCCNF
jgi:hypothetical protein